MTVTTARSHGGSGSLELDSRALVSTGGGLGEASSVVIDDG
jgi:hypothetical protein